MTTLAKRITAARKEKADVEQVAQAVGVSRQTVSHWENGRVELDVHSARRLPPAGNPCGRLAHAAAPADSGRRRAGRVRHDSGDGGTRSVRAATWAEPEAAQGTPVPQSEKYSWDWFQQPDAQPVEGQAHIELTTAERPLMLTERAVATHSAAGLAAAVLLTAVKVYLRAGTAGAGAMLPEVVLLAEFEDTVFGNANILVPDAESLFINRCCLITCKYRGIQAIGVQSHPLERSENSKPTEWASFLK